MDFLTLFTNYILFFLFVDLAVLLGCRFLLWFFCGEDFFITRRKDKKSTRKEDDYLNKK